jgi:hypothetical protein
MLVGMLVGRDVGRQILMFNFVRLRLQDILSDWSDKTIEKNTLSVRKRPDGSREANLEISKPVCTTTGRATVIIIIITQYVHAVRDYGTDLSDISGSGNRPTSLVKQWLVNVAELNGPKSKGFYHWCDESRYCGLIPTPFPCFRLESLCGF